MITGHAHLLALFLVTAALACQSHPTVSPRIDVPQQPSPPAAPLLSTLHVDVRGLRNQKGNVLLAVFTSPNGFPADASRAVARQMKSVEADAVTFDVPLLPGRYAISALHDENANLKMDRSVLGIPLEGYGASNNPHPLYRPARFDEAALELPGNGARLVIVITMQYF